MHDEKMTRLAEGRLKAARAIVERACELLIMASPQSLDRCAAVLEKAVAAVKECRPLLAEDLEQAGCRRETHRLRLAVRCATQLLENAARFQLQWDRTLRAMTGYDGRGEPAQLEPGWRVLARG